jgi:putative peptide zinc metalloprotease protein
MANAVDLPVFAKHFVFGPVGDDGKCVVKDLERQTYFRLGEKERFLLELLDGSLTRHDVRIAYESRFNTEMLDEDLDDFLELARTRGLLQPAGTPSAAKGQPSANPTIERPPPEPPRPAPAAALKNQRRIAPRGQSILAWRKSLFDPDRLFTWLEPKLRFFWTWGFLAVSAVSIATAAVVVWLNRVELAENVIGSLHWQLLALGAVVLVGITALHESAHGLTCKHYGGEVHEVGFLLIFFMPAFFCNVSDAWLLPERRKRLAITFAGGYFELFLWSLAVFVWRMTLQNTTLSYLAGLVVSVSGMRVLVNVTPFIKLDGYYLLSDALELPNLRQRSLECVTTHLRWLLWGAPRPAAAPRRWVLLTYGILCWCLSMVMLGLMLAGLAGAADRYVGHVGAAILVTPLALVAGRLMFHGLFANEAKQMLLSRYRRSLTWAALLTATGCTLAFVKIEQRVSGTFQVDPLTHMQVRAPVAGFLKAVAGDEGEHVSQGQRVALLDVPDLDSRIAQKRAEVVESEAQLALLRTGATQEELDDARHRVARAIEWRDLAQTDLERSQEAFTKNLARLDQKKVQVHAQLKQAHETALKWKELFEKHALSEQQFHEAVTSYRMAKAELAQVTSEKAALKSTGTLTAEAELARREKELAEAQSALVLLEAGTRDEEIAAAEASLARQREELAFLEEQQAKLPLYSSVEGVITTPHFEDRVGEWFDQGDLICEIKQASHLEVEITLDEDKVAKVKPGQEVELKARALAYQTFNATVERIAPAATSGDLQSTVTVYSRLTDAAPELRPEMTGYARIYCGRKPIGEIAADYVMRFVRTEFWW